jgi:hypothetical protein
VSIGITNVALTFPVRKMLVTFFLLGADDVVIELIESKYTIENILTYRMGNQIDTNGYLSQLNWRPAVKLNYREIQFLFQFLEGPESVTSMHRSINRKFDVRIKKNEHKNNNDRSTGSEEKIVVVFFSRGPLSKPAVRKRIRRLLKYRLIEKVTLSSITTLNKEIINYNLRRAKPFKITEYALFCILSQEIDYPVELFSKYWESKVLTTLLSPYFEESSIVHASPLVHFAVVLYLNRACRITNDALNKIKEVAATITTTTTDGNKENDDKEQERQDIIARLEDDLDWHAKSFALRLLVLPAGDKKWKQRERRFCILERLASDKKFSKLLDTTVHEVQASYKGWMGSRR